MSEAPIAIERVSHHFGEGALRRQILYEISAEIRSGEIVILTGPSGSGKTTLLTLIGALRSTQDGSLRVLGHELRGADETGLIRVRKNIGYVFQSHNLIDALTAAQNVAMSLKHEAGASSVEKRRRVRDVLESVGLGDHLDHYPSQLSGGERQRVAIARALARRPKIVLADEPTASLDKKSGRDVVERLQGLAKEQGVTVLLVTHDSRILDVAASGESINIQDAERDPLFDPDADRDRGYRAKNLLCVPVEDRRGEVFAVVELVNKVGGGGFTPRDEVRVRDFTRPFGVLLEAWWRMSCRCPPIRTVESEAEACGQECAGRASPQS